MSNALSLVLHVHPAQIHRDFSAKLPGCPGCERLIHETPERNVTWFEVQNPGQYILQWPPSKEVVWDKNGNPLEKPLCCSGKGTSPDIPQACGRKTRFLIPWGLGLNSHFKRIQDERTPLANFRAGYFISVIDSNWEEKHGIEGEKKERRLHDLYCKSSWTHEASSFYTRILQSLI